MLESLRKAAHSWIAKGLFALLILSFAIWGIGDVVRGGMSAAPAIVAGRVEVSSTEVLETYRREVIRMQRMFGAQFTEEQARQMGMLDSTIEQISARALLDQAGNSLDLTASDEAVMQALAANPSFRNELGQFDRFKLKQTISQMNVGEGQFLAMVRKDLLRSQLIGAVSDGVTAPAPLVQALFAHRAEKRVADLLVFQADKVPNAEAPDEAALKAFHEANSQRFMAPEYRSVSAIVLRPADIAGEVTISDKDLEEAYAQRAHEYVDPEMRTLRQIVFADEAKARKAAELAQSGQDLAAVGKEVGEPVVDLGQMDRQTLAGLSPELADTAFALPQPGVTQPVKSPFGWHLVGVADIRPGKERSLAEVRDQLKEEVLRERAIDRLYELANKIEDTLASGKTLDEAAQKHNVKVVNAASLDADGNGPDGKPVEGVPASAAFLKTVFEASEGSDTRTAELENNGGFFVAHVGKVTAPAVRPFDTVKDEVRKAWQAEQRLATARKQAEQALALLKDGKAPEGVQPQATQPFTRSPAPSSGVAAPVAAAAFRLQPGQADLVNSADGAVVVVLQKIVPADPQADSAELSQVKQQVSQQMTGDVVDQLVAALHAQYGVKVNRRVIEDRIK